MIMQCHFQIDIELTHAISIFLHLRKEGYSHFQTLTIPGIENGREDVISAWQSFYDTDDDEEVLDQKFGGARADYDSSGEDNDAEKIGSHVPPTPPSEVDGPPSAAEASFSGSEVHTFP